MCVKAIENRPYIWLDSNWRVENETAYMCIVANNYCERLFWTVSPQLAEQYNNVHVRLVKLAELMWYIQCMLSHPELKVDTYDRLGDGPRETVSWNDDYLDEDSGSEEDELMTGVVADDPNKFDVLCDGVLNTTALLHESLKDFLEVKDMLLQHFLPPSVLLSLSTTSSKLFRR